MEAVISIIIIALILKGIWKIISWPFRGPKSVKESKETVMTIPKYKVEKKQICKN